MNTDTILEESKFKTKTIVKIVLQERSLDVLQTFFNTPSVGAKGSVGGRSAICVFAQSQQRPRFARVKYARSKELESKGAGKPRSWKAKLRSPESAPRRNALHVRLLALLLRLVPRQQQRCNFRSENTFFTRFLFFRGVHHRRCVGLVIGSQILTHTCIFCRNTLHRPSHPFTHQRCSSLAGSGDLMASFSRTRFRKCSLHLVFCTSCEGADVFVVWKKRRARVAP